MEQNHLSNDGADAPFYEGNARSKHPTLLNKDKNTPKVSARRSWGIVGK